MRCIIFPLILGTQIFSIINAEEVAKPAEDTKSVEISKKDTEATKPPEPIVRESSVNSLQSLHGKIAN